MGIASLQQSLSDTVKFMLHVLNSMAHSELCYVWWLFLTFVMMMKPAFEYYYNLGWCNHRHSQQTVHYCHCVLCIYEQIILLSARVAPTEVTLSPSILSTNVHWKFADNVQSRIRHFAIEYSSDVGTSTKTEPPNVRVSTLSQLRSGQHYEVCVVAVYDDDFEARSDKISFTLPGKTIIMNFMYYMPETAVQSLYLLFFGTALLYFSCIYMTIHIAHKLRKVTLVLTLNILMCIYKTFRL